VLVVHFMRFTSNGYPQGSLFAFEYDTSLPHGQVERSSFRVVVPS
jgi:hypothetical protein